MDCRIIALAAAALLLAGCPYGAQFPLGDPAAGADGPAGEVDEMLRGAWVGQSEDGEPVAVTIAVTGAGDLVITAANPDGSEAESVPAVVTEIDGERFLSVYDEAWFLLNCRVADGTLRLRLVDDALFEDRSFASPEELRAFVRAHLADPLLYGADGETQWDWELKRVSAAAPEAAPAAAATAP